MGGCFANAGVLNPIVDWNVVQQTCAFDEQGVPCRRQKMDCIVDKATKMAETHSPTCLADSFSCASSHISIQQNTVLCDIPHQQK